MPKYGVHISGGSRTEPNQFPWMVRDGTNSCDNGDGSDCDDCGDNVSGANDDGGDCDDSGDIDDVSCDNYDDARFVCNGAEVL